ncbi:ribosome silencing factor [Marinospirillum perlucidum]|uniref:ribosome silencing factor n=1 Tax=Marinospirillum perlucidum TaxID=1982602 RepID=UPI000DF34A65|nr:ribosome silencing factor [Marinospirillum perlucidum]
MQVEKLKSLVLNALEDLKAKDVCELDVREASSVTDFMLIASGTSSRQVSALATNLVTQLKEAGVTPLSLEGLDAGDWVLVDLGDLLVHIMQPETRSFYDLEKLWGDFSLAEKQA